MDPEGTDESLASEVQQVDELDGDVFSVTSRRVGARSIVAITGELDLTTLGPLRTTLSDAMAEGVETVELDTTGVTYIDSVALATILAFQVNGPKEGVALRVVAVSEEFARIVTLAGLGPALLPEADSTG